MKAKFIFIHATGAITHQTTIYSVWFGSSQKDQRDLKFFNSLRFNADYYFSKYTDDVAEFIYKLNQSLFHPRPEQGILLNTQTVTPSELKKMVLSGVFSHAPLPKGYCYFRGHIDPHFYIKNYRHVTRR